MPVTVFTDGLCQPKNPGGVAIYAFIVSKDNKKFYQESGLAAEPYSEGATNNVAEYTAVVKAIEYLKSKGLHNEDITLYSDSKLVIEQLNGNYKVKSANISSMYKKIKTMFFGFSSLKFVWVPREENKEADRLTKIGYNEFLKSRMESSE